jgi:glycine/sarcosine/betaine reductase complex component C subunit alpha
MSKNVNEKLADIFYKVADAIESGEYSEKRKVAVTTLGSELGVAEIVKGAELAARQNPNLDIGLIGQKIDTSLPFIFETNCEKEAHKKLEEILDAGEVDACVTNHFNFPIGVATVGRVITPGKGKELIITTTTGTSSTNRITAMLKNAIYGIIAAKALGNKKPTIGILNVDGARQVEKALKQLKHNGYDIHFAESSRSDGGCVMRGNDLLLATSDIMVTDTLTGNVLMKVFSAFNSGGSYEALGYGYGPGISDNYDKIINIISRASGAPVIASSILYAGEVAKGELVKTSKSEFTAAKKAGLMNIISEIENSVSKSSSKSENIPIPPKKTVTSEITGIDILALDDAMHALWKKEIYAESGMGCTGPVILTSSDDRASAIDTLKAEKMMPVL